MSMIGARWWVFGVVLATAIHCLGVEAVSAAVGPVKTIEVAESGNPPEWAFRQRQLLEQLYPAATEFVEEYTNEDGTLIWRESWPGMDGSDDGYESFYNFPLYYAVGGPSEIDPLSRELWNAVTRQFTEYGQVVREFDGYYDWMHHGESYTYFYFFGLSNPDAGKVRARAKRFASFYTGEDPMAPNYDPKRHLIRSPINGSRGPRFLNSAEDWVTHRSVLANYPLPFKDIPHVNRSEAWVDDAKFPYILKTMNERMMRGDVPLNLTSTSLILNAYMHTQAPRYRKWILEYVSAWMDRVERNDGILPDNVGLAGEIGQYMDGKWWGGYYGWRWPHGLFNQLEATLIGGANAFLASGDPDYLELPRSVMRLVEKEAKRENGRVVVPNRHGDDGWYDYRPIRAEYLVHLWYLSQEQVDADRIERLADTSRWDELDYHKHKGDWRHSPYWLAYLNGRNPDYPTEILKATYQEMLRRLDAIRNDEGSPETWNVHHWQQRNPVVLEGLVQTMLGAPNHIYHGGLLHCRVRYFDPERDRPGVPPDVAALVYEVLPDAIGVKLVNLHPTESRRVVLQAGAFGEHQFTQARHAGELTEIDNKRFAVELAPGAIGKLEIGMERFEHPPRYE